MPHMRVVRSRVYWITEFLAIGPRHDAGGLSVTHLKKLGFKHVIDLNANPEEERLAHRVAISYHPLRITDRSAKKTWLAKLQEALAIIGRAERNRHRVFMHCTNEVGRSPTLAMGYLVHKGQTVDRAIDYVKRRGREVWYEGNPVKKYREILEAYTKTQRTHLRVGQ